MARDKKGSKAADAAAAGLAMYALGPQSDGSIVLRIPDDFHLMLLRKACEKQEKNAGAAEGTLGALAEGDDPWLDRVQRGLAKVKSIIASARAPENQIADTPIGKEINAATRAALAKEKQEPIDGQPEGTVWAPHVPKPRPRLGERIVFADDSTAQISGINGYEEGAGGFLVRSEQGAHYVVAHVLKDGTTPERGLLVWRVAGAIYTTDLVPPSADFRESAEALPASQPDEPPAAEGSAPASDPLTSDAPSGSDDDEGGELAVEREDEQSGDPSSSASSSPDDSSAPASGKKGAKRATTPAKSSSQRARNQAANGIKGRPIGGKKRGGNR